MSNVGYATVRIIPSALGFQAALDRQLRGPLAAAGASAGRQAGQGIARGLAEGGRQGAASVEKSIRQAGERGTKSAERSLGRFGKMLGIYAGGYFAIAGAVRVIGGAAAFASDSIVGFNSRLEQSRIAFTSFLGSAGKADAYLQQLQEFARTTPFEFDGLRANAQQLIAMGFAAKDVLPTLRAIGDAAAGAGASSEALNRVVLAFGQIQAKGRVQSDELLQLQEIGIPALKILANQYGLTTLEMQKLISENKVLAEEAIPLLVQGLENGTKTTAAFGGMMEKQSKTWQGALSNIKDSLQQTLAKGFQPFFQAVSNIAVGIADKLNSAGAVQFGQRLRDQVNTGITALRGLTTFVRTGQFNIDLEKAFGLTADSPVFESMQKVRTILIDTLENLKSALSDVASNWQRQAPVWARLGGLVGGAVLVAFNALSAVLANVIMPVISTVTTLVVKISDVFARLPGPIQLLVGAFAAVALAGRLFNTQVTAIQTNTTAAVRRMVGNIGELRLAWRLAGVEAQATAGRMQSLATRVSTFNTLAGGTQKLKSGLTGLVGVLGGPWGIALAGGAAALAYYSQQQANAKAYVDSLTASMDAQTGAATASTFAIVAQKINESLKPEQWVKLREIGVDLDDVVRAFAEGGTAVDALKEKLKEAGAYSDTYTDSNRELAGAATDLYRALYGQDKALASAAQAAGAAARAADVAAGAMSGLSVQARAAKSMLDALPKDIRVTAKAEGFAELVAAADAAYRALVSLSALGRGATPGSPASARIKEESDRTLEAIKKALADIAKAQAGVGAAIGASGGGSSSGGSGGSSKSAAAKAARGIAASYIEALVDAIKEGQVAVANAARKLFLGVQAEAKKQGNKSGIVAYVAKQNAALVAYAKAREVIVGKLKAANQRLEDLKTKAADLAQSTAEGIKSLFDASALTNVKEMVRALQVNVQAAQAFQQNLLALAKRGLNATSVSQLAAAGVLGAGDAARALANASDEEIARINALQAELEKTAGSTGSQLANQLYSAGIAAAQGLVRGLASQQSAIEAMMLKIALAMQAAIKRALGIRSPSRVFAGVGEQIADGLVVGMDGSRPSVDAAVQRLVSTPDVAGGGAGKPLPSRQTIVNINGSGRSDVELAQRVVTIQRREDTLRAPVVVGV